MSNKQVPMNVPNWKVQTYAKLPMVVFGLIVLLLSGLLIVFQNFLIYRIDAPLTDETVLSLKEEYAGCQIIARKSECGMHSFYLRSSDGKSYLVTLEEHYYTGDFRLVGAGTFQIQGEITKAIFGDFTTLRMTVDENTICKYSGAQPIAYLIFFIAPLSYVFYGILILTVGILAAVLFRKIRS